VGVLCVITTWCSKKISKKGRMWVAFVSSQHGAAKMISGKGEICLAFVSSQHGAAKMISGKGEICLAFASSQQTHIFPLFRQSSVDEP